MMGSYFEKYINTLIEISDDYVSLAIALQFLETPVDVFLNDDERYKSDLKLLHKSVSRKRYSKHDKKKMIDRRIKYIHKTINSIF